MIDFTRPGRRHHRRVGAGSAACTPSNWQGAGASVVVNDLGGAMGGEGADALRGRTRWSRRSPPPGGVAVASHDSVDSPEGGEAIAAHRSRSSFGRLDAVVSNAGIFTSRPVRRAHTGRLAPHAAGPPRRRLLPRAAGVPGDEIQGYGRFVFIRLLGRDVRPAPPKRTTPRPKAQGLVGLTNVIALEAPSTESCANTVLPLGHLATVTETLERPESPRGERVLQGRSSPNSSRRSWCSWPGAPAGSATQNFSACGGRFARVFVGLGEGWLAEPGDRPHRRRHRGPPHGNRGDGTVSPFPARSTRKSSPSPRLGITA